LFNSTSDSPGVNSPASTQDALPPPLSNSTNAVAAGGPNFNPALKKYVVPAWARTNTTTQLRLLEEVLAQRAAAEAKAAAEKEKDMKQTRNGRSGAARRKSEFLVMTTKVEIK
jgi:hypothetical protein